FVQYSAPDSGAPCPPTRVFVDPPLSPADTPYPNRRYQCDKRQVRTVCIRPAIAVQTLGLDALPLVPLRKIRCAGGYSANPGSWSRPRTTVRCLGILVRLQSPRTPEYVRALFFE